MLTPQVPIAKEGLPFIFFSAFCTLILALIGCTYSAVLMLFVTTFVLAFFRDPERFVCADDDAIVSPADGKVISIEQLYDEQFTAQKVQKISIFMNVFNVHVNRAPMAGTIDTIIYRPGKFYSADSARGGLENEYCATVLTTTSGKKIAFVQIAGLIARRIICWFEPGDIAIKGQRFGLIRFGSRVDLYLPAETELAVKIGEKVRSGETLLGRLS